MIFEFCYQFGSRIDPFSLKPDFDFITGIELSTVLVQLLPIFNDIVSHIFTVPSCTLGIGEHPGFIGPGTCFLGFGGLAHPGMN